MDETTDFMRRLDSEYRARSELNERRFYSIFYSRIVPSSTLVLGFNRGGTPEDWEETKLASTAYYDNWEHEYVDCDYPIAVAMRDFLPKVLSLAGTKDIRRIPKTNLIFRRSSSQTKMSLRPSDAIREAQPILTQILRRVSPRLIICEGITTLDNFERYYCSSVEEEIDGQHVTTPNGRHLARIYRADKAHMISSGTSVILIGIGHPSRYSGRREWKDVIQLSRKMALQN